MRTLSTAPVRYVPLGRPCNSCDWWAMTGLEEWKGGVFVKLVVKACYCQKAHRSLDVGDVLDRVIPKWCPNVLHIMVASGEQN